jgi:hypothetical protein
MTVFFPATTVVVMIPAMDIAIGANLTLPYSWAYRKEKIRGAETNLPDFPDFARQVPKKFSGEKLF